MSTLTELIQKQNQLLAEQNQLLREVVAIENHTRSCEESGTMMTERDLQLILSSDNIVTAIDRWNESRGHGRGRKRKVARVAPQRVTKQDTTFRG